MNCLLAHIGSTNDGLAFVGTTCHAVLAVPGHHPARAVRERVAVGVGSKNLQLLIITGKVSIEQTRYRKQSKKRSIEHGYGRLKIVFLTIQTLKI